MATLSLFCIISPLRRIRSLEFLSSKGCFLPSFDEIGPMTRRKKTIYEIFCHFLIIFPWNKTWSFFWTNLNPHHSRTLHTLSLYGWNIADSAWITIQVWLKFAQLFWIFKSYQQEVSGELHWQRKTGLTDFRTGQNITPPQLDA